MASVIRKLRKNLDPNAVERAERSIVIKRALQKRRDAQLAAELAERQAQAASA